MSVRVIDVMISCRLCTDHRSRTGVRQARDTSRHASTRESVTSLCYTNGWSVLKSTKFFKLGLLEREREGGGVVVGVVTLYGILMECRKNMMLVSTYFAHFLKCSLCVLDKLMKCLFVHNLDLSATHTHTHTCTHARNCTHKLCNLHVHTLYI